MCGIFNVVSKNGQRLDMAACRRALSKLNWRGPHLYTHTALGGHVFFGQTILSIVGDINESGGDHLRSASGRFFLGFNGEIYNYPALELRYLSGLDKRVQMGTDAETLVNLHDVLEPAEIPAHLDGMYCYTVLDSQANRIYMARDPQGEKSLYLYEDDEMVVISSEIAPILAMKPAIRLDRQALCDYFHTRHLMLFDRTVYVGIRQLLPGQFRTFDLERMTWTESLFNRVSDWIKPDWAAFLAEQSMGNLTDILSDALDQCVLEMIPDRQFASVMSGGVDSSLISGLLLKHGNPELLVAVNHLGKDQISNDLEGFRNALGRTVTVLDVDIAAYTVEIERCQKACGSPLHSHSFIGQSIQSSYVRAKGCRVLFGGEGADELFGGYAAYLDSDRRNPHASFSPSPYSAYVKPSLRFLGYDSELLRRELGDAWKEAISVYSHITDARERAAQAMMYCDFIAQVPAVGLRGADFMSMMWSVETRSVFIRKSVVSLAFNLPVWAKSNPADSNPNMRTKPLLKEVFKRFFPAELLVKKQGFSGFPNESAHYLGNMRDFLVFDYLGIDRGGLVLEDIDRATAWKLINVEHFLRHAATA